MSDFGTQAQLLGGAIALFAVFLPSTLLLLFFYPIYQNLKQHVIIYRALEGINAMIVGIIWASGILFTMEIFHINIASVKSGAWLQQIDIWSLLAIAITYLCLKYTKLPAPVLVITALVLGYFWG